MFQYFYAFKLIKPEKMRYISIPDFFFTKQNNNICTIIHNPDEEIDYPSNGFEYFDASQHSQLFQVQDNSKCTNTDNLVSLQSQPQHISASQTLSDFKNCSANKTFKRNSSLLNFIDIVTKEDQEKFELSFAMFVFGNCLPLNITENRSTIDHYKSIRPGFLLPSRHKLSNKLLNTHYNKLLLNLKEKINESYNLGLTCDGWTNVKGDSIINFIITTPEPIFLKSIDTK